MRDLIWRFASFNFFATPQVRHPDVGLGELHIFNIAKKETTAMLLAAIS